MAELERAEMLMTLMRQLEDVLARETACVRTMQIERMERLQSEKVALSEAYEIELRAMRGDPDFIAALPVEIREELERTTRRLQGCIRDNANALNAARKTVDRMVKRIAESLQGPAPAYGAPAYGQAPCEAGRVIAVAFNHTL